MNHVPALEPADATIPTNVRRLVVALTTAMAFFLYLDRFCLSFVERFIQDDLGVSNRDIGRLFTLFFFGYAIGQVPSGWLSDRFGARPMLALYILLWSLFTGWMGLAMSFALILAFRFGCGLAQAGAYPTGAGIISKWVLFSGRGLASAIVSIGGRLGGAAAPILTSYLIIACVPPSTPLTLTQQDILDEPGMDKALATPGDGGLGQVRRLLDERLRALNGGALPQGTALEQDLNALLADPQLFANVNLDEVPVERQARTLAAIPIEERSATQTLQLNRLILEAALPNQVRRFYGAGWRPVLLIYGAAGGVMAAAYWLGVRNKPREHPRCNAAEAELIEKSLPAGAADPHGQVKGVPIRALLRHTSLWFCSGAQFFTNLGWLFLVTLLPRYLDEVHHVPVLDRGWLASVPIVAGIVGMLTGGWITDFAARRLGIRLGRLLPVVCTRFVAAAAYFTCLVLQAPWPVTLVLAVVALATDLGTPAVWAYSQDVGGRHSGSVLGWGNMWGNFGAMASREVLDWVGVSYSWNGIFIVCGLSYVVSGLLSFGIDASVPLAPDSATPDDT